MSTFAAVTASIFVAMAVAGRGQTDASGYVPVAKTPPPGNAPGMKVLTLSKPGEEPREFAVIFAKGDEVAGGMLEFARQYKITSAHFTAIGAFSDTVVGWMDRERKAYKEIPIRQQVEVLTMAGDIAEFNGNPVVHSHLVVGLEDGTAKGGHLLEAHVFPTLEVMVTVDPVTMQKKFDPATGLALINSTGK